MSSKTNKVSLFEAKINETLNFNVMFDYKLLPYLERKETFVVRDSSCVEILVEPKEYVITNNRILFTGKVKNKTLWD